MSRSQSSVELVITLAIYLAIAAALLSSSFELYKPAYELHSRTYSRFYPMRLVLYEVFFRDLEMEYELNGEYTFTGRSVSYNDERIFLPFYFSEDMTCSEKVIFERQNETGVKVSCAPR